jgi:hypothetical protein
MEIGEKRDCRYCPVPLPGHNLGGRWWPVHRRRRIHRDKPTAPENGPEPGEQEEEPATASTIPLAVVT